jgi:hypothetical protein
VEPTPRNRVLEKLPVAHRISNLLAFTQSEIKLLCEIIGSLSGVAVDLDIPGNDTEAMDK